ncbi:30S ribosomal protein S25e [Sulfuracidifex metallicus]|uniref:30S ribosomal protein S25e n=1 Tax=Sulfuracidifex metallicus TaxID=47303 RepID=UPI002275BB9D|nr:30S ribosomal protein S25e [Sulfuracidifex metallicus]MCY0850552.1 30S ribosomal protein S25e [Sulfuracidifex metallicus]
MGGVSKKPLSNVEKKMKKEAAKEEKKVEKKGSKTGKEVISKTITLDNETKKKVMDELKREKIVTPYSLASKSEMTISVAKKMLEEMEKQGIVKLVSKNRRVSLYVASS